MTIFSIDRDITLIILESHCPMIHFSLLKYPFGSIGVNIQDLNLGRASFSTNQTALSACGRFFC